MKHQTFSVPYLFVFSLAVLGCSQNPSASTDSTASSTPSSTEGETGAKNFTITPSGSNATISPSAPQAVKSGSTKSFTVTATSGNTLSSVVAGTCPTGSWSGSVYTTGAVTANCTVQFSATASGTSVNTLQVGPGKTYATISAAVSAASSGSTIEVFAGTYTNDFPPTLNKTLTIKGVGGKPMIRATQAIPNRKGIFLVNGNVTLLNLEITGAMVSEGDGANGAAIRVEGGNLIVDDCYLHDNQNGMLGVASGTVTIQNSRIAKNGVTDSANFPSGYGYTHSVYISVDQLTITNSYFFSANIGHHIKSRSSVTIIKNNVIVDGSNGTASYNIDIPNGGQVTVQNNLIEKGPSASNSIFISYGAEGMTKINNSVLISGNTLLNDRGTVTLLKNYSTVNASITGNKVFGLTSSQMANGPATVSGTTTLSTEPYTAPSWTMSAPTPWPSEATGG